VAGPTDPYEHTLASSMSRTAADRPLLEPEALVDHFKVLRLVGRGGMGEVYLARDTMLGRRVALKVVRADAFRDADAIARFLLEARITAQFNHPHIVTVYAVGEHRGSPYVALEFLEGQNLRERIAAQPPAPRESLRIGLAIATALAEAHAHHVLHRDLKPENVILGKDGRLRVVDFGLAKPLGDTAAALAETVAVAGVTALAGPAGGPAVAPGGPLAPPPSAPGAAGFHTRGGGLLGTPLYMAPEQWLQRDCTSATDVWALGLMLWELLNGRHPFAGAALGTLAAKVCAAEPLPALAPGPQIPAAVAAVVARCLEKDQAHRPSATEVAETLDGELNRERGRLSGEQSPFRGLLPFTEQHATIFFGRDAEVAVVLERLRAEPVLTVVGPSGSGKSSLVQAGVIPRLREQGRWVVMALRPGRSPFAALAARLLRGESRDSGERSQGDGSSASGRAGPALRTPQDEAGLAHELAQAPGRLALLLQQLADQESARVLLFVDQLEELYTLVEDEALRRRFLDAVCAAADDPEGPVRVIFTLRDDFLGRMAYSEQVREALSHVMVLRSPGVDSLAEVMSRPLHAAGYEYDDPALVEEMVAAVRHEPAALALLQFAGQALWERRDRTRRSLTRGAYAELGGVAGALAHHADAVVDGLPAEQVKLARELLLRLVTPEGTRRVLSRTQLLEQLGAAAGDVLDRLAHSRLVLLRKARAEGREEAEVELVHESLVRNWERLARWLDEGREELQFLAEIGQAAELWDRRGRRDAEVWQGDALHDALRHAERVAGVPELVQDFLDAGGRLLLRARARRRRVLGAAFGALALVAAIAVGVALVMVDQKAEVKVQRDRAEVGQREAEAKRAEALREGAQAALVRDELLEARAKLRVALEIADTRTARALWSRLQDQPLLWKKELAAPVNRVAFSPDGRFAAAACEDGHVYLIDVRTTSARPLRGHTVAANDVAFSPDGRRLATAGGDRRIGIWDVAQAAATFIEGLPASVTAVAFSPNGRLLAAGDEEGRVRLWDAATRRMVRELPGGHAAVLRVAFSPDGGLLAAAGLDGVVRLHAVASGAEQRRLQAHAHAVRGVAFTRDGRGLLAAGTNGGMIQWDVATGARVASGEDWGSDLEVAVNPSGRQAATGTGDLVCLWTVAPGLQPKPACRPQPGRVLGVAFSPDGRTLLTGSKDRTVRLWRVEVPTAPEAAPGHSRPVADLAFSPDGRVLLSGGDDRIVRGWSTSRGDQVWTIPTHVGEVSALAWGEAGRHVLIGGFPDEAELWDVGADGKPIRRSRALTANQPKIRSVALSPDERVAATGTFDQTVRLWDVATGAQRRVLAGHRAWVDGLSFSPDGRRLAASALDHGRVWDVTTGALRQQVDAAPGRSVEALTFTRNGRLVAAGGDATRLLAWVVDGDRELVRVEGRGRRTTVAIAPDGARLAAGYATGAAAVWRVPGGERVDLLGHRAQVNRVRFSPDGRLVATGGNDDTVRLWETRTGRSVWRAPVLLLGPPELLTHRGWIRLDPAAAPRPDGGAWRAVVERDGRAGSPSPDGTLLCLQTPDGGMVLLDLAKDAEVLRAAVPGLTRVLATNAGCLTLADGKLTHHARGGAQVAISEKVTAVTVQGTDIAAAGGAEGFVGDAAGTKSFTFPARPGATAVARVGGWIAVGTGGGRIELLPATAEGAARQLELAGVPTMAVERIVAGPEGTLVAGFANGFVGLWDLQTGLLLRSLKLHGPAVHLAFVGGTLYAASELGDHRAVDLKVIERPYCELLREVWAGVPVTWENGAAVVRTPAREHACAPR
jgi:WD40 repeat protein/serine/threonine protein kinase